MSVPGLKGLGGKKLKSIIRLFVPAAFFLGGLCEIHLHVVNKSWIIFVHLVPLKQFVHLNFLAQQLIVIQFIQVFFRVQMERGKAVLQAEALHIVSQDDVKSLQLGLGHPFQVIFVPRVALQPFSCHAVVWVQENKY